MSNGYQETLCRISYAHKLYVVYPFPEFGRSVPAQISAQLVTTGAFNEPVVARADYESRNRDILPVLERVVSECDATAIEPFPSLCPDGACTGTHDGHILFTDSNHLTAFGVARVAPAISEAVRSGTSVEISFVSRELEPSLP